VDARPGTLIRTSDGWVATSSRLDRSAAAVRDRNIVTLCASGRTLSDVLSLRSLVRGLVPCIGAVSFAAASAQGATPPACTDSYLRAQILRKQDKLISAREELRACSRPACPGLVVNDCTQWLEEVQAAVPSVVPVAADETGANLVDVALSIDGELRPGTAMGRAVELDPGPHRFSFEREGFETGTTQVLVAIGERNKRVAVTLRRRGAPVPPAAASGIAPLRVAAYTVAVAGGAALAVGGLMGALALSKQSDAHCPNNLCGPSGDPGDIRTAISFGDASTALFIAGGVAVATGVTTLLLTPSRSANGTGRLRANPFGFANGGGFALSGEF